VHERINVSSPNTRIGLYCFLIRSTTLVARADALFWDPSAANVCAYGQLISALPPKKKKKKKTFEGTKKLEM
jgi:hypothetical protein